MKNPTQSAKSITVFQERVYSVVAQIPVGFVTTYGVLAKMVDCHSPQAIGQALRKNPFAPGVPCHRVVRSDGSLGGFFGNTTTQWFEKKQRLLESEGVVFEKAGVVAERFILRKATANNPPHFPSNSPERRAGAVR